MISRSWGCTPAKILTFYETTKLDVYKNEGQKKEYRCTPTFVNLKSNTMKNTLQN